MDYIDQEKKTNIADTYYKEIYLGNYLTENKK